MIELRVLGTNAATPTKERGLCSVLAKLEGISALFDAPEGVQRQMMIAKESMMRIKHIFISHWHEDHFLGLYGMLQTMNLLEREEELSIWMPKPTSKQSELFHSLIGLYEAKYPIKLKEITQGELVHHKNIRISAFPLEHGVSCFGFKMEEEKPGKFNKTKAISLGVPEGPLFSKLQKGEDISINGKIIRSQDVVGPKRVKKICLVWDTRPTEDILSEIKNSDILLHETTFAEEEEERALETLHSTTTGAAKIAKAANAKELIGIHISARYKDTAELEQEMQKIFPKAHIAKEFETIQLR